MYEVDGEVKNTGDPNASLVGSLLARTKNTILFKYSHFWLLNVVGDHHFGYVYLFRLSEVFQSFFVCFFFLLF